MEEAPHLRALLWRQRKQLGDFQQRRLPEGWLVGQQVAGQLGVDHPRVQRVGCIEAKQAQVDGGCGDKWQQVLRCTRVQHAGSSEQTQQCRQAR